MSTETVTTPKDTTHDTGGTIEHLVHTLCLVPGVNTTTALCGTPAVIQESYQSRCALCMVIDEANTPVICPVCGMIIRNLGN